MRPAEKRLSWVILALLAYIPFHAFVSTWLVSVFGHENLIEAAKDGLLAVAALVTAIYALRYRVTLSRVEKLLAGCIFSYVLLHVFWLPFGDGLDQVLAGLIINLRFYILFAAGFYLSRRFGSEALSNRAFKISAIAASLVIAFGVLQVFVLPKDFLTNFGYGPDTIKPYQTVDNDESTNRILSTTRGPNPLGAYLIIGGSAVLASSFGKRRPRWQYGLAAISFAVVMYATYSRAAWLGAGFAVSVFVFLYATKYRKVITITTVALLSVGLLLTAYYRDSAFIQKTIFHVDPAESSQHNSDNARLDSLSSALGATAETPIGHGVGTSGIAASQGGQPRTIENYFLEVGYQMGWLGLVSVLAIHGLVLLLLWGLRSDPKSLLLMSVLAALSGINLLWPAWGDETVSYTFWGLTGIYLGYARNKSRTKSSRARA